MIPFAADLAPEERRGRVVARIMTGLLLGILLARTVSGLVAQAAGWRAIYWLSAALMVVFAVVLWRALPSEGPRPHRSYPALVGLVAPAAGDRARAAAAGLARRLRLRRLQRAVDHAGLPSLGQPVPLLQPGHRALRPRRCRAGSWRPTSPASWRTRTGTPSPPSSPASCWPAPSRCCGPAAPHWPPSSSGSSCSTWARRACRSPTSPSSTPCVPTRGAGSTAPTWSATSSAAPSAPWPPAPLYGTHGWAGVCAPRCRFRPPHARHVGLRPSAAAGRALRPRRSRSPLPS